MHDVFISYSHKDSQTATMVLNILEQNGIKCWIDYRDAMPGESFAASIVRAIKQSKFFVLLLSGASGNSQHVLNEINSAVNACVTIIPFKIDGAEISEGMEYYLGKTHWLDALTPPIEAHIHSLVEVVQRYSAPGAPEVKRGFVSPAAAPVSAAASSPVTPPATQKQECRMVKYEELIELGYTASSIALQLVENDYINCNGIGQENEGTAEQWEMYLQDNSDTFQYLINSKNEIVGDWSIVALSDEVYAEAEKGELLEADIDVDKTEMICFPGIYNGYVLTISALPNYRNTKNYNLLVDSFIRQIEEFSENGIFFRAWCMNVFSKEVEMLVRGMGFRYVCDNKVFGKIYTCSFMPLPKVPLLKKYPKLVENYENI